MLFAIEIIINAANLNLVAFARFLSHSGGQTLALFSIAIAAAEVAVGLALIIVAYRMYKNVDIAEELALPPVKIHCSVLAEDAIKAAINDLRQKQQ